MTATPYGERLRFVAATLTIKLTGVLVLIFLAMSFIATVALGLIAIQVPAEVSSAAALVSTVWSSSQLALAILPAGWVILRRASDSE